MDDRICEYCGDPLPADARSDQRFCSRSHKSAARKQRRKREQNRARLVTAGIPLDSHAGDTVAHAADARFRAILAAEEDRRQLQVQEREWREFERRNPGIAHPGRTAARMAQGTQDRAADWTQGTARFVRSSSSIAEQARSSRARQQRPLIDTAGEWDEYGELEPAQMIEGGPFRTGHRHAGAYLR